MLQLLLKYLNVKESQFYLSYEKDVKIHEISFSKYKNRQRY